MHLVKDEESVFWSRLTLTLRVITFPNACEYAYRVDGRDEIIIAWDVMSLECNSKSKVRLARCRGGRLIARGKSG